MAEVPPTAVGVGADAEVGQDEPGHHEDERRPQGHDEREVGAANEQQRGDGRGEAAGRPGRG